ncbi:MAG: hypothetical protein AAGF28_06955 [Pseudomonadota bacterium]
MKNPIDGKMELVIRLPQLTAQRVAEESALQQKPEEKIVEERLTTHFLLEGLIATFFGERKFFYAWALFSARYKDMLTAASLDAHEPCALGLAGECFRHIMLNECGALAFELLDVPATDREDAKRVDYFERDRAVDICHDIERDDLLSAALQQKAAKLGNELEGADLMSTAEVHRLVYPLVAQACTESEAVLSQTDHWSRR